MPHVAVVLFYNIFSIFGSIFENFEKIVDNLKPGVTNFMKVFRLSLRAYQCFSIYIHEIVSFLKSKSNNVLTVKSR